MLATVFATVATFLWNCIAQALSRGDGPRPSIHASAQYRECNDDFFVLSLLCTTRCLLFLRLVSLQETFQYLPQQRRLTKDECSEVASMLKMKANKKLIQEYAQSTFGKVVSLKDIHNVATKSGAIKENSLKELVEEMKKCAGGQLQT